MRNAVITLLEGMGIKHDTFQSGTTFKQSSLQSQPCVSETAMPDDYTHTHTNTSTCLPGYKFSGRILLYKVHYEDQQFKRMKCTKQRQGGPRKIN